MALKTYKGPAAEVEVKVAGRFIGIVKKGNALAVPDDVVNLTVWQEACWSDELPKVENKPLVKGKDGDK